MTRPETSERDRDARGRGGVAAGSSSQRIVLGSGGATGHDTRSGGIGPAIDALRALPWRRPADLAGILAAGAARGLGTLVGLAWRSPTCRRIASICLFAAALGHVSLRVQGIVHADVRYRVSRESLASTAPPPGLAKDAIQELATIQPGRERSFSLHRAESVAAVAAAFQALPWVREVRSVEKLFPAKVRFDLVVRRPVAGLEHQGERFLLDEDLVLLPRRCYEPFDPDALKLPVIVRAKLGKRALKEGMLLEDVPVKHGVAVAVNLLSEAFDPLRKGPVRIDVSNVNFDLSLSRPEVTVLAGETVLEWGRSEAAPGENLPLSEKIAHFTRIVKERPLDKLAVVRLQFDEPEWRERPVTGTAAAVQ